LNIPFGNFKVYDTVEKRIIEGNVAITTYTDDVAVSIIEEDPIQYGFYLNPIGHRERYIVIPEVPRKIGDVPLYVGDILSNGSNLWVIKFDLMIGIYCTSVEFPDAFNRLDNLLKYGWRKVGDIFTNPELLDGKSAEVFL
jgi:hypothetical protein